jgi:hypothetical protein
MSAQSCALMRWITGRCSRDAKGSLHDLNHPDGYLVKTVIGDALPRYLVHCSRSVRLKISVVRIPRYLELKNVLC